MRGRRPLKRRPPVALHRSRGAGQRGAKAVGSGEYVRRPVRSAQTGSDTLPPYPVSGGHGRGQLFAPVRNGRSALKLGVMLTRMGRGGKGVWPFSRLRGVGAQARETGFPFAAALARSPRLQPWAGEMGRTARGRPPRKRKIPRGSGLRPRDDRGTRRGPSRPEAAPTGHGMRQDARADG